MEDWRTAADAKMLLTDLWEVPSRVDRRVRLLRHRNRGNAVTLKLDVVPRWPGAITYTENERWGSSFLSLIWAGVRDI